VTRRNIASGSLPTILTPLTLLFVAMSAVAFAQTVPPLPQLALETYPPSARDAISTVHKDASARPNDAVAVAALARTLHAWEQWDAAHHAYARCQRLAPRDFSCQYLDALVLQRLALHAEAVTHLRQALAITPDYLPAQVALAESLFETSTVTESRQLFESLAGDPRSEPAAQLGLARIDAAEGHDDRAVPHFQRAIELFPEFGAAYYGMALSYRRLGRTPDAQAALAQHARFGARWPALDDPMRDTVAVLRDDGAATLRRGVALAENGDVRGAIAAHEAALAKDPSLVQAHANLISLYGRAGELAKAEAHYQAAVKLGTDLTEAHYDYGVVLALQEKWEAAADAYRKTLALNPAHVQARNNLGQVLERQRQFAAAADEYRQALDYQPAFRLARFNLGRMLIAAGRNDEAIAELTKLAEPQDSDTPKYLFALSTAYIRAGRKNEGITWATEARRLAIEYGQQDLAAAIERDLARLK
jgi:tetratricopeptide (TPR) repeat protein